MLDRFLPIFIMTFLFFSNSSNLYHTEVQNVKYGDRQLSVCETGKFQVIFDSGSSYTYLPNEIYENLVAAVSISNSCVIMINVFTVALLFLWFID
jgi:hypothetical protein